MQTDAMFLLNNVFRLCGDDAAVTEHHRRWEQEPDNALMIARLYESHTTDGMTAGILCAYWRCSCNATARTICLGELSMSLWSSAEPGAALQRTTKGCVLFRPPRPPVTEWSRFLACSQM